MKKNLRDLPPFANDPSNKGGARPTLTSVSLLGAISLLASGNVEAAWLWTGFGSTGMPSPPTSTFAGPSGVSGGDTLTPDPNFSPNPGYSPSGQGWEQTPVPVPFTWSTVGGEPVAFNLSNTASSGVYKSMGVDLDPDGDSMLPTELVVQFNYPLEVTTRAVTANTGGGLGAGVNPVGMTLSGELSVWAGDGTQIPLDSSYVFLSDAVGTQPNSFSNGSAVFNSIDGAGHWHTLTNNGLNHSTHFPWVNGSSTPDPAQTVGTQRWTFSNFSGGTSFLFSLDGGVPANAQTPVPVTIPEPSRILLLGFGLALVALRRRRRL